MTSSALTFPVVYVINLKIRNDRHNSILNDLSIGLRQNVRKFLVSNSTTDEIDADFETYRVPFWNDPSRETVIHILRVERDPRGG
jgi:hypothetical protein